jgi:hypothetical protein
MKINCIPQHDGGGEVPSSENLSIFSIEADDDSIEEE